MKDVALELLSLFDKWGLTFSAAESCTGGLINATLTSLPGSSSVVLGGVVSYSNSVKEEVLSVKRETLDLYGAVSESTALQMAEGVRALCKSDISVSVSGIAGPGGGTVEKPVGTVCFGISSKRGSYATTEHFKEDLSRDEIRNATVIKAIRLAIEEANIIIHNK